MPWKELQEPSNGVLDQLPSLRIELPGMRALRPSNFEQGVLYVQGLLPQDGGG